MNTGLSELPLAAVEDNLVMTDEDFDWLRKAAQNHSGIMLPEAKRNMLFSRLSRRLRALGLRNFADYRRVVEDPRSGEFAEFINALTTNLTYFFREPHHFQHLASTALRERVAARRRASEAKLRLWSAACSTGQEPYSIMMTVRETAVLDSWQVYLRATDLDSRVLATARAGIYPKESLDRVSLPRRSRWFLRGRGDAEGLICVKPELRKALEFGERNLIKSWTEPEPFDIVFCRNVVIYFDKATQRKLFHRIADAMVPGGYLYLGHSETLFEVSDRFELVGKTIYRRL